MVVEEADKQAIKEAVARSERRTPLRFTKLQIPIGATLTFVKDVTVTCEVIGDGQVRFENIVTSPSSAALEVVKRLGYNWSAVSGSDYWEFEGETLSARRMRMEDEGLYE